MSRAIPDFDRDNREAAGVILADVAKYGGEEAGWCGGHDYGASTIRPNRNGLAGNRRRGRHHSSGSKQHEHEPGDLQARMLVM